MGMGRGRAIVEGLHRLDDQVVYRGKPRTGRIRLSRREWMVIGCIYLTMFVPAVGLALAFPHVGVLSILPVVIANGVVLTYVQTRPRRPTGG